MSLLRIPAVFFIVVLKTVVGIPAGVFHSMFSMVNLERFQLTPESNGRLLSYVGILTMVCQQNYTPVWNSLYFTDYARSGCWILLQEIL